MIPKPNISNIRNNILPNKAYKKLKKENRNVKRNTQVETQYIAPTYRMRQLRGISCMSWPRRIRFKYTILYKFKF